MFLRRFGANPERLVSFDEAIYCKARPPRAPQRLHFGHVSAFRGSLSLSPAEIHCAPKGTLRQRLQQGGTHRLAVLRWRSQWSQRSGGNVPDACPVAGIARSPCHSPFKASSAALQPAKRLPGPRGGIALQRVRRAPTRGNE